MMFSADLEKVLCPYSNLHSTLFLSFCCANGTCPPLLSVVASTLADPPLCTIIMTTWDKKNS
jgi:hypothetical protein